VALGSSLLHESSFNHCYDEEKRFVPVGGRSNRQMCRGEPPTLIPTLETRYSVPRLRMVCLFSEHCVEERLAGRFLAAAVWLDCDKDSVNFCQLFGIVKSQ
jgi:hypothetical protein